MKEARRRRAKKNQTKIPTKPKYRTIFVNTKSPRDSLIVERVFVYTTRRNIYVMFAIVFFDCIYNRNDAIIALILILYH